jgi:hypothetical protein
MATKFLSWLAVAVFLSGCSIHPVPEDVTGVDTPTIVRQIRCETRETIRLEIIKWMRTLADAGDPLARDLALRYERDPESISTFNYELFKGKRYERVRAVAKLFYDTGVAYNFDMTMTEDNDISAGTDLLNPMTLSKFTLAIKGSAKRKRSNNRTFTITDTFSGLITKLNTEIYPGVRYCNGKIVGPNYIYPIAGRIGVDKLVQDFIKLTLFGNLGGEKAKPGAGGVPTMTDKLSFTTAFDGSLVPTLVFTPVTSALHVTNATLTGSAVRSDLHVVTMALAIAPSGLVELDTTRTYLFSDRRSPSSRTTAQAASASSLVIGRRVIGGGTPSETLAVLAIDQIKSRELQLIPSP